MKKLMGVEGESLPREPTDTVSAVRTKGFRRKTRSKDAKAESLDSAYKIGKKESSKEMSCTSEVREAPRLKEMGKTRPC